MLDHLITGGTVVDGTGAPARAADVDVFVTSDLRHHPASEFVENPGGPALVDTAHFASEWPWLADGARHLVDALGRAGGPDGANVEVRVSTTVTDAWSQAVSHV